MFIVSIIALMYFLLFIVIRAFITKYLLLQFSIETSSTFSLFIKYFFIALIINVPFILIGLLIYYQYGHLSEKFDMITNSTMVIPIFYLIEAFLITKIIKDKKGGNIAFKMALILVLIFFIFDIALDFFYPVIEESFTYTADALLEDQVSSILEGEQ